jgi:hypothetical protein
MVSAQTASCFEHSDSPNVKQVPKWYVNCSKTADVPCGKDTDCDDYGCDWNDAVVDLQAATEGDFSKTSPRDPSKPAFIARRCAQQTCDSPSNDSSRPATRSSACRKPERPAAETSANRCDREHNAVG